jgi:hypothetical protein
MDSLHVVGKIVSACKPSSTPSAGYHRTAEGRCAVDLTLVTRQVSRTAELLVIAAQNRALVRPSVLVDMFPGKSVSIF